MQMCQVVLLTAGLMHSVAIKDAHQGAAAGGEGVNTGREHIFTMTQFKEHARN